MNVRDLIPWNRGRDVTVRRGEEANPFLTLHREMNRVFDDVFRGFDLTSFGSERVLTWPNIEVSIQGEKKTETEDRDRLFSERYYGRFERQIPLGDEIEEDKVAASFKNSILTVTLPKTEKAQAKTKRIAINGNH